MFKKTSERVKLQRVAARPTEADLYLYVETCRRDRVTKYNYFWTSATAGKDYMLSVKYAGNDAGHLAWRLHQGSGPDAKELWFHLTENAQQIYKMVVNSCGEVLETAMEADQRSTGKSIATIPKERDLEDIQALTFDGNSSKIPMRELEPLMNLRAALNGDLALVHITTVLQSLHTGQVSGRLILQNSKGSTEIFIENGTPVHAVGPTGSGLDCALQVIAWKEGKFNFEPHLKTDVKTIDIGLNALIMQGAHLQDNTNYLLEKGIRNETILARKRLQMPESEFDAIVAKGEPIDNALQKSFYLCIDDRCGLKDIVSKLQLPRMKWVPLVANLLRCDLIIASTRVVETKLANVAPKKIDAHHLQHLNRTISRPETGILGFPALLFMLEHDLALREGTDRPLSIVLFEIHAEQPVAMISSRTSTPPLLQSVCQRITQLKKPSDTFGHYENADFALIMPDTKPAAAKIFCERILESLDPSKFVKGVAGSAEKPLMMTFGIASIPEHANSLAVLLAAAEQAKYMAKSNNILIAVGPESPQS